MAVDQNTTTATRRMSPGHGLWTLINRDLKGWYKNPASLFIAITQPLIWLVLYGKTINLPALYPPANGIIQTVFGTDYFSFLSAGLLAFIVLFASSFSGIGLVFERRFGFLGKALSTP